MDKNKALNDPANVFVDPGAKNTVQNAGDITKYAEDLPSTIDMKVKPAAAADQFAANGSFDYDDKNYHPAHLPSTSKQDDAWNQEETAFTTGKVMSGLQSARLYGAKVNGAGPNFMRVKDYSAIETPLSTAEKGSNPVAVATTAILPTAVKEDTLKFVQFGRLSGLAEPGKLKDVVGRYVAKDLKQIPFADAISNAVAVGGVSDATDFYFARGNTPTALDKMKAIGSGVITYHGQALTYGLDNSYHGPQQNGEPAKSDGSVPNSTKEVEKDGLRPTLLGGRGNFVVARFAPDQGKVDGRIYNVWNVADISVYDDSGTFKYHKLKKESDGSVVFDPTAGDANFGETTYMNVRGYMDNLIGFSGAVNGNQIVGDAIRYDNEKGKFAGAFFGDKAEELAGVISSSVKYNGSEPNAKWGAVFGAKATERSKPGQTIPRLPTGTGHLGWSLERK